MRLLKYGDDGEISLTKDLLGNDELPPYAILSHTWGDGEVTFEDLTNRTGKGKTGLKKIQFCMQQAAQDGILYSWVDTCCINKADATELQHAINSMFRWYRDAAICYVFLSDVSVAKRKADSESFQSCWEPAFQNSRWFTRGWTLQELLAPHTVKFFSREGKLLGKKQELTNLIHSVTKLPIAALAEASLHNFGVEERLGWTKERMTTREEDKAYSLLGIFGIFMPLIYGEGQANAFRRLRKEIQERRYASQAFLNLSEQNFDCLQSLSYLEQEHRHNDIHTAFRTCEWLFRDLRYNTWINSTRSLFWIKGNPGSGKSVLMKHAVKSIMVRKPEELVVSYFIHGQGSELQRTPTGVYRALLNSLLGHFPICLAKLTAIFEDREKRFGGYTAGRWHWSCKELQESLTDVLLEHTQDQQVTVFVDALDECGEGPARNLLAYFSDLSRRAEKRKAKVRVCLSSRHYPILGLDHFPSISVEENNNEDIQWYVTDRLRGIRPSKRRQQMQEIILSKAQGGFQWVLLITETLIDRTLAGKNPFGHLEACPPTLSEMYAALLNTGSDEDKRQTMKLFQWVLFAKRPLSAQELREALATDANMTYTSVAELRSHGDWAETLDDFERYVKFISKGLIAFKSRDIWEQWEDSDREAQLIHQTVADFLLERYATDTAQDSTGAGHFQISRSCLRYLTLREVLDEPQLPRDVLSSRFPLAPYAVRYVFDHIKRSEEAGLDQSDFTSTIKWSSQSETVRKLDALWRSLNPIRIGTPAGWPFIGSSEAHLYAALGLKGQLLATLKDEKRTIGEQDLNGNSLLHVALLAGHPDVALLLLSQCCECGTHQEARGGRFSEVEFTTPNTTRTLGLNAQNNEGDTPIDVAVAMKEYAVVTELIAVGADLGRMSQPHLLVRHAISNHDETLLAKIIMGNINLAGAVYFAIENDSPNEIISELLKAGGDLDRLETSEDSNDIDEDDFYFGSRDENTGGNALHLACRDELAERVDLLLSHGASATALDSSQQCPLHVAVFHAFGDRTAGYEHIVESLLRHAPTAIELMDVNGRTPMSIACDQGHYDFIRIFLEKGQFSNPSLSLTKLFLNVSRGAGLWNYIQLQDPEKATKLLSSFDKIDLSARDGSTMGRTVFWLAAANGIGALVERLMTVESLDVNERDKTLTSPLLAAVRGGHISVVKSLLTAAHIDVNAKDENGMFPLLAASEAGDFAIVEALLSMENIDVNATDERRLSPLLAAASAGFVHVVEVLLTMSDIKVNDRLFAVVMINDTASLTSLLKNKNGNINAKNGTGMSLLSTAVQAGNIAGVEVLLLQEYINVNAGDQLGVAPLHRAVCGGNITMVQLLLQVPAIDVNIQDKDGATPLLVAARHGRTAVLQLLLRVPTIDINAYDQTGTTPLFEAVERSHYAEIDLLLAAGAIETVSKEIFHPLLRATLRYKTPGVAELLLKLSQGKLSVGMMDKFGLATLNLAIQTGDEPLVKLLLPYVRIVGKSMHRTGQPALMVAVSSGNPAMVQVLIEARMFNLDSADCQGRTPLWLAARQADKTIFKMLLATATVDLEVEDEQGRSLLSWAAEDGVVTVVMMLLSTGRANLNHRDNAGMTPLQKAERNKHRFIATMLQAHASGVHRFVIR